MITLPRLGCLARLGLLLLCLLVAASPVLGASWPIGPNTRCLINIASGNKVWKEIDYEGAGPFPLRFVRTYNSQGQIGQWFGDRWSASYEQRVAFDLGAECVNDFGTPRAFNLVSNCYYRISV